MTKKTEKNVLAYIRQDEEYLVDNYGINPDDIKTDEGLCRAVWDIFREETKYGGHLRRGIWGDFKYWASGLALAGLFLYYYNRDAVADYSELVGRSYKRLTESAAEERITGLIFDVLTKYARA